MTLPTPEILNYYREPGPLTELGEYAPLLKPLPRWVPERMAKLQGLMLHIFWAENYDFTPSEERQEELNLRTVQQKIKRILELDNQPLNIVRQVDKRLLGNCRDYSTMLVAFLLAITLYHQIPRTAVRWREALWGALRLDFSYLLGIVRALGELPLVLAVRKAYPPIDRIGQRSQWTEE